MVQIWPVQVCNSHEVMCYFYEWLPSLLSVLWLSHAHWWILPPPLFFCLVCVWNVLCVYQRFLCLTFCFHWHFVIILAWVFFTDHISWIFFSIVCIQMLLDFVLCFVFYSSHLNVFAWLLINKHFLFSRFSRFYFYSTSLLISICFFFMCSEETKTKNRWTCYRVSVWLDKEVIFF